MARATGERICVGAIAGAHGVRGLVKIKSFTAEPQSLISYGPITDEIGTRRFAITLTGQAKGVLLARIEGIQDRDQAQALRGTRLYVNRAALPELEEEEYYHADLIGLDAIQADGKPLGRISAVHDFGAGDILEVAPAQDAQGQEPLLIPFTKAAVPVVDLTAGRVEVRLPEEIESQRQDEGQNQDPAD